jgi:hypothetical protein
MFLSFSRAPFFVTVGASWYLSWYTSVFPFLSSGLGLPRSSWKYGASLESMPPANYRIFGYVQPPALLLDFNNDALLANYCEPPHIVLNPHGNIDRRFIEHPEFDLFLHAATEYGLLLPNFSQIWLPIDLFGTTRTTAS